MSDAMPVDIAPKANDSARSVDPFGLVRSSYVITGLGGRAAIALGILMLVLVLLPSDHDPAVGLIASTGFLALVLGFVLIRKRHSLPMPLLDVMLIIGDGMLVYIGQYGGPLAPAFPGMYLVIGTIIFAGRSWSVVTMHVALLGASYAGVLAVGPHTVAPLTRWIAVMTALVTTGIFLRWLVGTVAGLAAAEHAARDAAERATAEFGRVSRAKSLFLARMSHELRTPLNVVLGFADLLGEQRVGPLNERQQDYVLDISESARHLVALVDDVFDLATVESGGVRLNAALFDVAQLLEDSVTLVRDQATRKDLTVQVDVSPDVGAIEADRLKVRQAVVNLLANAVKFTQDGGEVIVRARTEGDRVRIAIQDTGIGIAAQDLDRIFEEFAQSAGSPEGTGLGLPLARRFVESHGGHMDVRSAPGMGSTFTFDLPREPRRYGSDAEGRDPETSVSDHSAFTRPGSSANRGLITRIGSRLVMVSGVLAALMAAVTPSRASDRLTIAGIGLCVAVAARVAGTRLPRPSFSQVEWAGWAAVLGLTVLTYFAGPFASVAPLGYGWVTMVAVALWPRNRAFIIVFGFALCSTFVLVLRPPSDAFTQWLGILTLLTFNGEVVSWITRRQRRLVVAEQEAHSNANRVRVQLAAAGRHKSAFVANMSHELRTPLNAVIGFADLLEGGLVGPLNDRQREYVSDIQESARHLLTIINEVLDVAKLEASQMQLTLDVIPVRALLETVATRSYPRAGERISGVHLAINSGIDFIVADRVRLQQVLVQLVANAVKFTPDGGHVELAARSAPNGELHISVSDSGIGILPDQVELIFEPFHQGTRVPAHHVPTGTGLGLSLAKSLVELHGGRIWVVSDPDHGSTFTVALPVLMTGLRTLEPATRATQ